MSDHEDFHASLSDVCYHFFPDGCPIESLENVWPRRDDFRPVSADQTRVSVRRLEELGCTLSNGQLHVFALVANYSLPSSKEERFSSPVVDGDPAMFSSLLRSMLPQTEAVINTEILRLLFSAVARSKGARKSLLLLLTLTVRYRKLDETARRFLDAEKYSCIFLWALQGSSDAVRLLLEITKKEHILLYRCKQLRLSWSQSEDSFKPALAALIRLFAKYQPESWRPSGVFNATQWYVFPDIKWSSRFHGSDGMASDDFQQFVSSLRTWMDGYQVQIPTLDELQSGSGHWLALNDGLDIEHVDMWKAHLPYDIHDTWYMQQKTRTARTNNGSFNESELASEMKRRHEVLLSRLLDLVRTSGRIPSEVDNFLARDVFPMGKTVESLALIQFLEPRSFRRLNSRLLSKVEVEFQSSDSLQQYHIVASAIVPMLERWLMSGTWADNEKKVSALNAVVQWTHDMLLACSLTSGARITLNAAAAELHLFLARSLPQLPGLIPPESSLCYNAFLSLDYFSQTLIQHLLLACKEFMQSQDENTGDARAIIRNVVLDILRLMNTTLDSAGKTSGTILFSDFRKDSQQWLHTWKQTGEMNTPKPRRGVANAFLTAFE